MAGRYIINQTAGKRYVILEEDAEKIEGGYFDTVGVWHELEGPLDGSIEGRYVINETGGKRVVLLQEDAEKIGGGYFDTEGTWVPFALPSEFKNPIYSGTKADADAIEATFAYGYGTKSAPASPDRKGMRSTVWGPTDALAWGSTKRFKSDNFNTIRATFNRIAGSTNGFCCIVASEKIEPTVVTKQEFDLENMSAAYGEYRYAKLDMNENGTQSIDLDISNWSKKQGFYISAIYCAVGSNYCQFTTPSITLI